jgi:hypothetical protein
MIMIDRSRQLSEPLRWGRREKITVAALLACLVLAVVGLGVNAALGGSSSRRDCIEVTFASTTGGARLHDCGARARSVCATSSPGKGIYEALQAECRRAGFPFDVHS